MIEVWTTFEDPRRNGPEIRWQKSPLPEGCPRAFKWSAVIDGVTVRRSATRVWMALRGCNMTASPKRGQAVDDVAHAAVRQALKCGDAVVS